MPLTLFRDHESEYTCRRRDEQCRVFSICGKLNSSDRLLGLEYNSLLCAEVVNQVASYDGDGSVCEADSNLPEIVGRRKCRYLIHLSIEAIVSV
jgi:hypothetical protein